MKDLKIYAKTIDQEAIKEINYITDNEAFAKEKIRIMSDVHVGKGCVIGFTSALPDKIIPNIVGVDLYCGMLVVKLGNVAIDFDKIDQEIKNKIPYGSEIYENIDTNYEIEELLNKIKHMKCFKKLSYNNQIKNGIGTLGGGNHFIEIDTDSKNNKYLVIHSGSRNLGNQVAKIYQQKAIEYCKGGNLSDYERKQIINQLKKEHKEFDIPNAIKKRHIGVSPNLEDDMCYLEGIEKEEYLNDIKVCSEYARINRERMAAVILKKIFGEKVLIEDSKFYIDDKQLDSFTTLHNYIDIEGGYIRKGAVSAKKDERLIIPINMRDGSLICVGKGNKDWNYSAPHGAGRLMSRSEAKCKINIEEYKNSMQNIYSTTVDESTIDEAPQAYKNIDEIKEMITPTVKILETITPIYNFKASKNIK